MCPDNNYSISPVGTGSFRFDIAPIDEHLKKDKEVYGDLERATNPELERSFSKEEVSGFEDVATRPHYHHAQTVKNITKGYTVIMIIKML